MLPRIEESGPMSETELARRVEHLLTTALEETKRREALAGLHNALQQAQERLRQPMRVAIVGMIKAGKSTMMNALLGETLVATGPVEATFNVNWLKYGPEPALVVHFKDQRPPQRQAPEELERLTHRSDEARDYLLSIKYIEVFSPNPMLNSFNLIDTPGLHSFYEEDSEKTREFLKLYGQQLTQATQQEAENADAVLYLFSHSVGAEDTSTVALFQGPQMGHTTPINSIGVLTKADMFWPARANALDGGHEVAQILQADHPHLRSMFYAIVPVCGLLAWGAQTLTNEEYATLEQFACLPEERMSRLLNDARRFTQREYADVPVAPALREKVLDRLGKYGIWRAYHLLRSGTCDLPDLRQALLQESGLPALKHVVLSHFGNRAYLIKLQAALRPIEHACFWARQNTRLSPADREIFRRIDERFGQLRDDEHGFKELEVLRNYYQGKLPFTDEEVDQLLHATGEFGLSDRERLGLPAKDGDTLSWADWQEIQQRAEAYAARWRRRAIDPGASRETMKAVEMLGDAYDLISTRAKERMKVEGFTQ
jgi:GTPase Era involved in 16S rRNA processing